MGGLKSPGMQQVTGLVGSGMLRVSVQNLKGNSVDPENLQGRREV